MKKLAKKNPYKQPSSFKDLYETYIDKDYNLTGGIDELKNSDDDDDSDWMPSAENDKTESETDETESESVTITLSRDQFIALKDIFDAVDVETEDDETETDETETDETEYEYADDEVEDEEDEETEEETEGDEEDWMEEDEEVVTIANAGPTLKVGTPAINRSKTVNSRLSTDLASGYGDAADGRDGSPTLKVVTPPINRKKVANTRLNKKDEFLHNIGK